MVPDIDGTVVAMTSYTDGDGMLLCLLLRDSNTPACSGRKWRLWVLDTVSMERRKTLILDENLQVEQGDVEMLVTTDNNYVVLKVRSTRQWESTFSKRRCWPRGLE